MLSYVTGKMLPEGELVFFPDYSSILVLLWSPTSQVYREFGASPPYVLSLKTKLNTASFMVPPRTPKGLEDHAHIPDRGANTGLF